MQLLTTLVLCRPHGMMECWKHGIMIKNAQLQCLDQGFWNQFYSHTESLVLWARSEILGYAGDGNDINTNIEITIS